MIITKKVCDLCNEEELPPSKRSWDRSFGHFEIIFKGVPSVQQEYKYSEVCASCAQFVFEACVKAIKFKLGDE